MDTLKVVEVLEMNDKIKAGMLCTDRKRLGFAQRGFSNSSYWDEAVYASNSFIR